MEEALRSVLKGAAAVTALAGTRIDWSRRPQGAGVPAITLHRISGYRDRHLTAPSGLVESRVQVDCWGATYGQAKTLARAVVAVLGGYDTAPIRIAHVDSERDFFEGDGPDPLHRTSLDLMVWHTEA